MEAQPAVRPLKTGGLAPIGGQSTRGEQVLGVLTEAVVEGRLAPGSLHSVASLAAQLGVSRTPVREALIQLTRRGMVSFERNRGVRIMETSAHDLEEVFELRLWLEPPATRQAVQRLQPGDRQRIRRAFDALVRAARDRRPAQVGRNDRAFHFAILRASGNHRAAEYVDGLRDLILMRGPTAAGGSRRLDEIADGHRPIMEAIEAGDPDLAAEEMQRHIRRTADLVIARAAGWSAP
jgi:DNA-binding GntR family transcriptional regulator